jgi:hypothetical protein
MKTITCMTILFLFVFSGVGEAQILKKIGERAEQAAERTVLNKTEQKTSEKVGKGIDDTVDGKGKSNKRNRNKKADSPEAPASSVGTSSFADSYNFSYKYVMRVSANQKDMPEAQMTFHLEPKAPYMGMKINQQGVDMFQVIDQQNQVAHSFINVAGNHMASSTNLSGTADDDTDDFSGFTITPLPNKTIAGLQCQGIQLENDEWKTIMYFTESAPVSNLMMFNADQGQQFPEELKKFINPNEEKLLMYMDMNDKKNSGRKDRSGTMECILFEEDKFVFQTAPYKK